MYRSIYFFMSQNALPTFTFTLGESSLKYPDMVAMFCFCHITCVFLGAYNIGYIMNNGLFPYFICRGNY